MAFNPASRHWVRASGEASRVEAQEDSGRGEFSDCFVVEVGVLRTVSAMDPTREGSMELSWWYN